MTKTSVSWLQESRQFVVEGLVPMCRGFEAKAVTARQKGDMLFIPAEEGLEERVLMDFVQGNLACVSTGNDGTEPVYLSLEEGNAGSNLNGSKHPKYMVIDPNTMLVIDMINRNGMTVLSLGGQYQSVNPVAQKASVQFAAPLPQAKVASGMGSLTTCPYSILVALDAFEEKLGKSRIWSPVNQQQDALINWREQCSADISRLGDAVKGMCSQDAGALNKFLRDNGFNIQLDPLAPDDLGAVGILDLLVEWLNAGSMQGIQAQNGKSYPGVRIKNADVLDLWGTHYTVKLQTKDETCVYIMPASRPADQFQLMGQVNNANAAVGKSNHSQKYKGVDFPMINMRVQEDMSWLLGMNTVGEDQSHWRVTQALQENRLRMNQFGARAQSATAVCVTRGISAVRPFVVSQPFMVWFTKPDCARPLFAAWVDYPDWSDPGNLQ